MQHEFSAGRHILRPTTLLTVMLAFGVSLSACDKSKKSDTDTPGGGSASAEVAGPEAPTYATALEEAKDLPNRLTAKIDWVAQPIADAATVAADLQSLKASSGLDASQFSAMAKAAFTDGKVEITADVQIDAEQRAQLEATMAKLASIGPALESVPVRAKKATGDVLKLAVKAPALARKAAKEIKGELASAKGEAQVKLQADLREINAMPAMIKGEVGAAKTKILGLPKQAVDATAKLTASFAAG